MAGQGHPMAPTAAAMHAGKPQYSISFSRTLHPGFTPHDESRQLHAFSDTAGWRGTHHDVHWKSIIIYETLFIHMCHIGPG
jgi:hypothetical protein